jgi:hypothetical protein
MSVSCLLSATMITFAEIEILEQSYLWVLPKVYTLALHSFRLMIINDPMFRGGHNAIYGA